MLRPVFCPSVDVGREKRGDDGGDWKPPQQYINWLLLLVYDYDVRLISILQAWFAKPMPSSWRATEPVVLMSDCARVSLYSCHYSSFSSFYLLVGARKRARKIHAQTHTHTHTNTDIHTHTHTPETKEKSFFVCVDDDNNKVKLSRYCGINKQSAAAASGGVASEMTVLLLSNHWCVILLLCTVASCRCDSWTPHQELTVWLARFQASVSLVCQSVFTYQQVTNEKADPVRWVLSPTTKQRDSIHFVEYKEKRFQIWNTSYIASEILQQ